MGRNRLPEEEKKVQVSVSLPKWLADWLRQHENYSSIVEHSLLKVYKKIEE